MFANTQFLSTISPIWLPGAVNLGANLAFRFVAKH